MSSEWNGWMHGGGFKVESTIFAATPIADKSETPVVFRNVGIRYMGHTGNVNAEKGITAVVSAMSKLL